MNIEKNDEIKYNNNLNTPYENRIIIEYTYKIIELINSVEIADKNDDTTLLQNFMMGSLDIFLDQTKSFLRTNQENILSGAILLVESILNYQEVDIFDFNKYWEYFSKNDLDNFKIYRDHLIMMVALGYVDVKVDIDPDNVVHQYVDKFVNKARRTGKFDDTTYKRVMDYIKSNEYAVRNNPESVSENPTKLITDIENIIKAGIKRIDNKNNKSIEYF
jgi:hypothetical protein